MAEFKQKKDNLKKELVFAYSFIFIFFNLWILLNSYTIFSVVNYFINQYRRRRYIILGLYEVIGEYFSKNIAATLLKLIKEYGFEGNDGYFIGDNVELNNTCVNVVF